MALDSTERLALHQGLVDGLGPQTADRLMAALPDIDWSQLSTKQDLQHLEERIDHRFALVDERFARIDERFARIDERFARLDDRFDGIEPMIDSRLSKHTREMYMAMMGLLISMAGVTASVVGILGLAD
ncbi:MAG TPA: hypothetical protein VHF47_13165 [Acidimicrobiales bacterium]|nr:hypothetical protein [Acidimicrobiales bacterium]